jgi:hypothetical protein
LHDGALSIALCQYSAVSDLIQYKQTLTALVYSLLTHARCDSKSRFNGALVMFEPADERMGEAMMKTDLSRWRTQTSIALVASALLGCGGGSVDTPSPVSNVIDASTSVPGACRKDAGAVAPRSTVAALGEGTPEADADRMGMWSPVRPWPVIPIHAALMPDGRVMSYGSDERGRQSGRFVYSVWDPKAGGGVDSHLVLPNTTTTDLFCSAQQLIPASGELFISGGDNFVNGSTTNTGTADTTVFDWISNRLLQGRKMNLPRWYGTPTTLVNGEMLLMGGRDGEAYAEVRRIDGTFRPLSNVDTSALDSYYPRGFTAADGRVFGFDVARYMYFIETDGSGRISPAGRFGQAWGGATASAALYSPGKILVAGGGSPDVVSIDFAGPQPRVTSTGRLSSVRHYASLTVLPNGHVLATGGSAVDNQLVGVNNQAEIWDPATGRWTIASAGQVARLYHSTAILLPDASVMVGGGGAPGPLNNLNAEIFFPPYLFAEAGRWADRPAILGLPTVADPGAEIVIDVGGPHPIARVTLVKAGSSTHSLNVGQRFVELPFTTTGNRLAARLPRNAGDLPPGFWMVFAIDDRGTPSVASMLKINVADVPELESGWTSTIGGTMRGEAADYLMACASDEVVVGIRGALGTSSGRSVIGRLAPMCVKADAAGRWVAAPSERGSAGSSTAGTFERMCPVNHAVVGLNGRTGADVESISVVCAALNADGRTTGVSQALESAGGTGGVEQKPLSCRTRNAATALYGRATGVIRTAGLFCRTLPDTEVKQDPSPTSVPPPPRAPTPTPTLNSVPAPGQTTAPAC